MPPTRDWATLVIGQPPGSRFSHEIDDSIREFKVDLNERLPALVYDVNAFPWVPKVPGVAIDGTQNLIFGTTDGQLFSSLERDIGDLSVHPTAVSVGGSWIMHVTAPRGSIIKAIAARIVCLTGATVSMTLRKIDNLGVNTNVVIVSATAGAGVQTLDTGAALTETISDTADYYVEVNLVANGTVKTSAVLYRINTALKLAGTP